MHYAAICTTIYSGAVFIYNKIGAVFNGYACESLSSHAWRERDKKWAKIVIKITDKFQKNHCERANKREQPVVDLIIIKKKLHQQTVGKQL